MAKYCSSCESARVHSTGSQLWVSCHLVSGWRNINSKCPIQEVIE